RAEPARLWRAAVGADDRRGAVAAGRRPPLRGGGNAMSRSARRAAPWPWTPAARTRALGIALVALSIVVVVGPFLWVLANSFKSPIAILTGAWTFVPTLDNYTDVLASKRS